jgi:hypothetical protein
MAQEPKQKRGRWRVGDILRIDLQDGRHAYAQVATKPIIVFFDGAFTDEPPAESLPNLPVAFRLGVYRYAVTKGLWPVVGNAPLTEENAREPVFFMQDAFSGRLSLYHSSFANYQRPATLAECEGLERVAVWEPEHVVDRLRDHFAGRPNKWVESLRIKVIKP